MSNIPSILDDAKFRHLLLEQNETLEASVTQLITNLTTGFVIPPYNDVVFQYSNSSFPTQPTYMTFKMNGTPVYYIQLDYDVNGALTRVSQD